VKPPFAAHDVGFAPSGRVWVTAGEARSVAVYGRNGEPRVLAADGAPQHVTFLAGRAFVSSGDDVTLRIYAERTARLLRTSRIPTGSYNVQSVSSRGWGGRILTPSLAAGTRGVFDAHGRVRDRTRVAPSGHDAA
jgi:hypothetical protein